MSPVSLVLLASIVVATVGPAGEADAPLTRDAAPSEAGLRMPGIVALVGGAGLGVASLLALTAGLDAERELRSARRDRWEADALLLRRDVAGWITWSTALLSAAGFASGAVLLRMADEPAAPSERPAEAS